MKPNEKGEFKVIINDEEWLIEFDASFNDNDNALYVNYKCFHDDTSGGGAEKELFLYGDVKWDGCSNWMFKECNENCYLHACTMRQIECWSKLPIICAEHALEHFKLEVTSA